MSEVPVVSAIAATSGTESRAPEVSTSVESENKDVIKTEERETPGVKVERSASPLLKKQKSEPATQSPLGEVSAAADKDEPPVYEVVGGSSIRRYLNMHVTKHLLEGLKEVGQKQPEDPLTYLGEFLITRAAEVKEQQTAEN